jgi:hypothetical protein
MSNAVGLALSLLGQTESPRKQLVVNTPSAAPAVAYTPEAMIDLIIENPHWTQANLAHYFGRSPSWFTSVLVSDKFQALLDGRRAEIIDPCITATLDERLKALAVHALDVLQKKMDSPEASDLLVLKAADIGIKGLGLGRAQIEVQVAQPTGDVVSLADKLVAELHRQRGNVRAGVIHEGVLVEPSND